MGQKYHTHRCYVKMDLQSVVKREISCVIAVFSARAVVENRILYMDIFLDVGLSGKINVTMKQVVTIAENKFG